MFHANGECSMVSAWLLLCIVPSLQPISSSGLIIPLQYAGYMITIRFKTLLGMDVHAIYNDIYVFSFARHATSFGWGRRRGSHLIWTGFPRRYFICIIFLVYGDALVRGSSLVCVHGTGEGSHSPAQPRLTLILVWSPGHCSIAWR